MLRLDTKMLEHIRSNASSIIIDDADIDKNPQAEQLPESNQIFNKGIQSNALNMVLSLEKRESTHYLPQLTPLS